EDVERCRLRQQRSDAAASEGESAHAGEHASTWRLDEPRAVEEHGTDDGRVYRSTVEAERPAPRAQRRGEQFCSHTAYEGERDAHDHDRRGLRLNGSVHRFTSAMWQTSTTGCNAALVDPTDRSACRQPSLQALVDPVAEDPE